MTPDDVLRAIERVRRAPTPGGWAVHKPLLLLLVLGRLQRGLPAQAPFTALEPEFSKLLREFAPSSAHATRHLPFWYLRSDGDGRLWTVSGSAVRDWHGNGPPGLTVLKQEGVTGGFTPEIEKALVTTPDLIQQAARRVLDAYFPETLHEDIAAATGLDLALPVDGDVTRVRRDPAFRSRVLQAYEKRCCICGFDLRVGDTPAGLEAAHIQWKTAGGPDVEQNGLCLCALHHKLFDLGAFTVLRKNLVIVFSQQAIAGGRGLTGALTHHGQPMLRPQDDSLLPAPEFLDWNYEKVFKRPERRKP